MARLHDAGAVLVAKLSLGALALNDIWFGGQTKNPWLLEEGASGSSAGPGAATAAGLRRLRARQRDGRQHRLAVDALRRGGPAADLRPRAAHRRDDAVLVARQARPDGARRRGHAAGAARAHRARRRRRVQRAEPASTSTRRAGVAASSVGYFPRWMNEAPATDVDRAALETCASAGLAPVEVALPDWPYDSLITILFAEAAAAFEELTLTRGVDELKMQVPDAWPNTFRQSRFLSAVDFVQADRLRRKVALEMARLFDEVDVLLVPSCATRCSPSPTSPATRR